MGPVLGCQRPDGFDASPSFPTLISWRPHRKGFGWVEQASRKVWDAPMYLAMEDERGGQRGGRGRSPVFHGLHERRRSGCIRRTAAGAGAIPTHVGILARIG